MPVSLRDHLVVALVAVGAVALATPVTSRFARLVGAVAEPDHRRTHAGPTPQLGGLALFAGLLAAVGAASALPTFDAVFHTTSEPEAVVLAAAVIVAVGLIDDIRGMSAPAKLAGQILAAGVLALFGVLVRFAWLPGDPGTTVSLGTDLAALVTIGLVVAMMNAINLIDGLDGLAAGLVAIAALALLSYALLGQSVRVSELPSAAPLLLVAVVGACIGFLVHNFHPASVFMGDTGSMLLGLVVGAAGISATGPIVQPGGSDLAAASVPVLVPALVLAVPFLDTIWAVLRRVRSRRAVFAPDKRHLHHRLIEIGHSHRRAVLTLYYWSAVVAFAAVAPSILRARVTLAVLAAAVCGPLLIAAVPRVSRARSRRRRTPPAGVPTGDDFVHEFTKSPAAAPKIAYDQRKRPSSRL